MRLLGIDNTTTTRQSKTKVCIYLTILILHMYYWKKCRISRIFNGTLLQMWSAESKWHRYGYVTSRHFKSPAALLYVEQIDESSNRKHQRVALLCESNSLLTGEFRSEMASNAEIISMSLWRHHESSTISQTIYMNLQSTLSHPSVYHAHHMEWYRTKPKRYTFRCSFLSSTELNAKI